MDNVIVGNHREAKAIREFPNTVEGYNEAVAFIETLPNYLDGRYYIDCDEELQEDAFQENRSQELADAGGDLTDVLTRLYHIADGDEGMVGEVEYEAHKAARRNYHGD